MSELPITPFAAVPGLETLGADDAGFCADGVCAVPEPAGQASPPEGAHGGSEAAHAAPEAADR